MRSMLVALAFVVTQPCFAAVDFSKINTVLTEIAKQVQAADPYFTKLGAEFDTSYSNLDQDKVRLQLYASVKDSKWSTKATSLNTELSLEKLDNKSTINSVVLRGQLQGTLQTDVLAFNRYWINQMTGGHCEAPSDNHIRNVMNYQICEGIVGLAKASNFDEFGMLFAAIVDKARLTLKETAQELDEKLKTAVGGERSQLLAERSELESLQKDYDRLKIEMVQGSITLQVDPEPLNAKSSWSLGLKLQFTADQFQLVLALDSMMDEQSYILVKAQVEGSLEELASDDSQSIRSITDLVQGYAELTKSLIAP